MTNAQTLTDQQLARRIRALRADLAAQGGRSPLRIIERGLEECEAEWHRRSAQTIDFNGRAYGKR